MLESAPHKEPQSAAAVLMVRPARFGFNPQTAESNVFQKNTRETSALGTSPYAQGEGVHEAALRESAPWCSIR
jgi:hypothetical protein